MDKRLIILSVSAIFLIFLAFLFIKSVQIEQKQNVSSSISQAVAPVSDSDWVKGDREAEVTLIEYSDLQCPACGAYYPVVKQLTDEFVQSALFVYRHFPLRQIHFNAQISAQAAEAAGLQGKFWEMHDLLFENQTTWAEEKEPRVLFEEYAKKLGLNSDQFRQDLDSDKVRNEVEKDYQSGLNAGVNATPTFFLNNNKIQNPASLEEFRSIIQKEIGKNE